VRVSALVGLALAASPGTAGGRDSPPPPSYGTVTRANSAHAEQANRLGHQYFNGERCPTVMQAGGR